ncbi:MAG: DUF429 domain-containing protein [Gammaproteobacteria bacterium]|nr:DUF429 domain-containing protein [Gammaproteobacteria bacterium]
MKIFGIDFTSTPTSKKPITCAVAEIGGTGLSIETLENLEGFGEIEARLATDGSWVAGLDFPFGQSRLFIENIGWPESWEDYASLVARMSREEFVKVLENYKAGRAAGDKEHRREIDVLASSISPQKLYGVPVGKMFYEGAKRILASDADIVPVRRRASERVIVEAYPAIVARRFIGNRSYKNDVKKKQTPELEQARRDIVSGIHSSVFQSVYGISLNIDDDLKEIMVSDASGDTLDSVLCAIQASWAYLNREKDYGIPSHADRSEGWIADPLFFTE